MSELAAGELDAVIAALPLEGEGLQTITLFEDPFLLASPVEAPVMAGDPQDLPVERLLLLEEGHCLRQQALGACAISDLSTFGATSLTTLLLLVAHGQGITLLPQMAAAEITDSRIALGRFPAPEPSRTVAMAWRSGSPRSKQLKGLAARLIEAHHD
jgi:LysR family hydrogen peroxide-inducible transcriptional activator